MMDLMYKLNMNQNGAIIVVIRTIMVHLRIFIMVNLVLIMLLVMMDLMCNFNLMSGMNLNGDTTQVIHTTMDLSPIFTTAKPVLIKSQEMMASMSN